MIVKTRNTPNNRNKIITILLILVIIFTYTIIFIDLVEKGESIHPKRNNLDYNLFKRLKSSPDMSSPLLWYSQTGYEVQTVAISSDGNYIVSGSKYSGKNLITFHRKDYSTPLWINNDLNGEVCDVDISLNGTYIVAGTGYGFGKDTRIYLFESNSSLPVWSYEAENIVFSVAISSDGNYIVAGSKDDRVYFFHKSSSTPIWSYKAEDHISSVAISNDGSYLVAGSGDHRIYFFERSSSTPLWSYTIDYISGNMGDVESVSISSDGNYIVAGTQIYQGTSKVYLFHQSGGTPLWKFSAGDYINSVSIDSNGNYLVAGSQDDNIYLFHKSNSVPVWNYTTEDSVNSVSISGDGNYIVSGGGWDDRKVYFFNRTQNNPLWKYETTDQINSVDISFNGTKITSGGMDNNIYLFKSNGSQNHATLFTDADNPDTNADFNLYLNTFCTPENISIYQHYSYITQINESVNLIASGNFLNNPYNIKGLSSGIYYFKIKIYNSLYGFIYSNCISVNIFAMYNLLWSRFYGDSNTQGGKGLCSDSQNNIYITGYIMDGPHGRNDGIIIKSSDLGVQLWNKTFGGGGDDGGMDVCVDSKDNIYVIGTIDSYFINQEKIILLKYNTEGHCYWNRTWYGLSRAHGRSIAIDSEDNIYVAGYAGDYPNDFVLIKYNISGAKIWERKWGGSMDEGRYGTDIEIDLNDNVYITGYSTSFGAGDADAVLIKYDKYGNQKWNTTWGGISIDGAEAITIDSMNNIFIAGYTDSFSTNGYRNLFIARFDDTGSQIWNRTWIGIGGAYCRDMTVDSNNYIFLTGDTYNSMTQKIFLLICNINGQNLWNTTWGHGYSMMTEGWGINVDSSDDIYISGYTDYYDGHNDDIILLKYSKLDNVDPIITINFPVVNRIYGILAPDYTISVQESHIDLMWYTLDYGINKYYFTEFSGTINQGEWDKFSNGTVVIRFYVKDEGGNEAFSEVLVNKDTFAPIITIHAPELGADIVDFPPVYSISIEEANLDTYWYTIDNGLNNHTISELTGIIDEMIWNLAPDGPMTITFYAKDKGGNIGSNEVIVVKRTTIQPQQQIPGYNLFILIGMVSLISVILIKRKLKS
ncbi:MAG: PQQ-binding-like beta-propeller repeat protein [Candidatus Hodarchaeota archaeon]